jgi:exodeoxyribonuclease-5
MTDDNFCEIYGERSARRSRRSVSPPPVTLPVADEEPARPRGRRRPTTPALPTLNKGQARVVDFARRWYDEGDFEGVLRVTGAAGTGKTTVIRAIIEALGEKAVVLCPTGKAVSVVREKLPRMPHIGTVHGACLRPQVTDEDAYAELEHELLREEAKAKPDRDIIRAIRREMRALETDLEWTLRNEFVWDYEQGNKKPKPGASVIIIDEYTMVNRESGEALLELAERYGYAVIVVGDPHQLPPVGEGSNVFTDGDCIDAPELTEVMRQAAGSAILDLATAMRLGDLDECARVQDCAALQRVDEVPDLETADFDVIICAFNATRHGINRRIRRLKGHAGKIPQPGERMMVLRNERFRGLYNGQIFTVIRCARQGNERAGEPDVLWVVGEFENGREVDFAIRLEWDGEKGDEETFATSDGAYRGFWVNSIQAGYAYALTCHKAQGSEYERGLVINESGRFFPKMTPEGMTVAEFGRRWRYTALTRLKTHATIVTPDDEEAPRPRRQPARQNFSRRTART